MSDYPPSELPPNERPRERTSPGETEPIGAPWHDWQAYHEPRRRGLERFFWPSLLLIAGFIFLAENLGVLPGVRADAWDWIMVAVGGLLLGGALLRIVLPDAGEPSIFWMIAGAALIAVGLGDILAVNMDFGNWWPVILIIIGLSALAKGLRR